MQIKTEDDVPTREPTQIRVGTITTQKQVKPKRRAGHKSKYDALIELCIRMKPGQVVPIEVEAGDFAKTREAISRAVRMRAAPYTPHQLRVQTTEDGNLGIFCYEQEGNPKGGSSRRG